MPLDAFYIKCFPLVSISIKIHIGKRVNKLIIFFKLFLLLLLFFFFILKLKKVKNYNNEIIKLFNWMKSLFIIIIIIYMIYDCKNKV